MVLNVVLHRLHCSQKLCDSQRYKRVASISDRFFKGFSFEIRVSNTIHYLRLPHFSTSLSYGGSSYT